MNVERSAEFSSVKVFIAWDSVCYQPDRPDFVQAQENPDLDEHPVKAPEGIELLPDEMRKLEADMVFLTLVLLHLVQVTTSASLDDVVITSKKFPQSWHLYS